MKAGRAKLTLSIHRDMNIYRLRKMREYLDSMRSCLDRQIKTFEDFIDEEEKKLSREDLEDFFEHHIDEYRQLTDDFPKQFFSSYILIWYSFIESSMILLCDSMGYKLEIGIRDGTDFGKGLKKVHKFLHKSVGFTCSNKLSSEMANIRKIRNHIAHGKTTFLLEPFDENSSKHTIVEHKGCDYKIELEKNLFEYMNDKGILVFNSSYHIIPHCKYCEYLNAFGVKYFTEVVQGIMDDMDGDR